MARTTLTVDNVVSAMARSVATLAEAESAFIDSAVMTCRAIRGGVSAASIARAAKAAKVTGYTSTAAVQYHGRTGAVLLIDGPDPILPTDVLAPMVQTLVKALPALEIDRIVQDSETVADAYDALLSATAKARRLKDKAAKVGPADALAETDETETDAPAIVADAPADEVPAGLDFLRSAVASILAYVESNVPVSTEAQVLLAQVSSMVEPLLATDVAMAN